MSLLGSRCGVQRRVVQQPSGHWRFDLVEATIPSIRRRSEQHHQRGQLVPDLARIAAHDRTATATHLSYPRQRGRGARSAQANQGNANGYEASPLRHPRHSQRTTSTPRRCRPRFGGLRRLSRGRRVRHREAARRRRHHPRRGDDDGIREFLTTGCPPIITRCRLRLQPAIRGPIRAWRTTARASAQ